MRTVPVLSVVLGLLAAAGTAAGEDKPPAAAPKVAATAWGKPVSGLQAGIRVRSSGPGPAVLELVVVIRNVGQQEALLYEPLGLYFWGESDGGTVAGRPAFNYGGFAQPGAYFAGPVGPGKEHALLGGLRVVRPSDQRELTRGTKLAPGTYRVGIDRFEVRVGAGEEDHRAGHGLPGHRSPAGKEVRYSRTGGSCGRTIRCSRPAGHYAFLRLIAHWCPAGC